MGRIKELAIDLDSLTAQEWADARAIAAAGGVDLAAVDLADLAAMPLPALAALIHVARRRGTPRATAPGSVRLAVAAKGATDG